MSYSNCYGFFMLNGIVFYAFLGVPQPYTIHTLSIHYPYTMTRPEITMTRPEITIQVIELILL